MRCLDFKCSFMLTLSSFFYLLFPVTVMNMSQKEHTNVNSANSNRNTSTSMYYTHHTNSHATTLLVDTQTEPELDIYSSHPNNTFPHDIITPVCEAFAAKFADAAAEYTRCFIVNSRPLALCAKCVQEYLNLEQAYHRLEVVVDDYRFNGKQFNRPCNQYVLNADKVMALQKTKDFFVDLWGSSHCRNCFDELDWKENKSSYSQHLVTFNEKTNLTDICFSNFSSAAPLNHTKDDCQLQPCDDCHDVYYDLSAYYQQLDERYKTDLCMDIVDSMNYTRIQWGRVFNCTGNTRQDGITITITVLFFILPAVFYVASYIHYQRIERKIVKQNRVRRRHVSGTRQPDNQSVAHSSVTSRNATPHIM